MEYELIRSRRKTLSVSVDRELRIVARAPLRLSAAEIERFLEAHRDWIAKQQDKMREYAAQREQNPLTGEQIAELRRQAALTLPGRVAHYSALTGLVPTGIKVTGAVTRWGSCSAKNSLCFSYRLLLLEPELADLVVVHELCHIAVKNHGKGFYALLARILPDYKEREQRLRVRSRQLYE